MKKLVGRACRVHPVTCPAPNNGVTQVVEGEIRERTQLVPKPEVVNQDCRRWAVLNAVDPSMIRDGVPDADVVLP